MKSLHSPALFILLFVLLQTHQIPAQNLSPSQIKTLFRLQRILEYPPSLSAINNATNFCYLPSSPSLTISCYGTRITGLAVAGDGSRLSPAFSTDSLFTTLSRLPSLSNLSLVSLGIWGPLPPKLDRLSALAALNLSSNHFTGAIPAEISSMISLKSIVLRDNSLNGSVPDLKNMPSLAELDLSGNKLGPEFPSVSKSLVSLDLKNNSFHDNIPMGLAAFDQLEKLDLSLNQFKGKIPQFLFSLPSVQYLDLSGNKFIGALPVKLSCGHELRFVDISSNLLAGGLPSCLVSNSSTRVVLNSWNCLSSGDLRHQHPSSYCSRNPLAAVLPTAKKEEGSKSKLGLIMGIIGGMVGGALVLSLLVFLVFKKARSEDVGSVKLPKPVAMKPSVQVSPRTPADARHMSQAVRIGTLGLNPYRVFTMEELEDATNGFDALNLISDGPQGQFYKGWLRGGAMVVVRCLKLKQRIAPHVLTQYMDVISKLRHVNLVSILGHCIPSGPDGASTIETIFLVSEYVSNGTLRSHLTEWRKREMLKWPQRVAAVIGVARGIQFLHTVTVPGIVGNDLGIENILLDETLTAKISNYNLPMLSKNKNSKGGSESPFSMLEDNDRGSTQNLEQGEKDDVYQLGLILLEIITGKPPGSQHELETLKNKLQDSLADGAAKLKEITDPTIRGTFAFDSLQTLVTVTLNCVAKDQRERPSVDDILWNLQYSVQVQDGWTSSDSLSIHSYN